MQELTFLPLIVFAFLIAFIYSSVGHGGASGYLALLSFYAIPHEQMAVSALCLNLLVSSTAFYAFYKQRHFSWRLTLPFILGSIPAAFLGGMIKVPMSVYAFLLGCVLIYAGYRLWIHASIREEFPIRHAPKLNCFMIGSGIGILSGIVGVGGGIFLSPLLLFFHWATPKQTAAASAFFILVNSLSGLIGRSFRQGINTSVFDSPILLAAALAAFCGGILGSHLGSKHFSNAWLRRTLSIVLFSASIKLFLHFFK